MEEHSQSDIFNKARIISKILRGDASTHEIEIIEGWKNSNNENLELYNRLIDSGLNELVEHSADKFSEEKAFKNILTKIQAENTRKINYRQWAAVAILILTISFATYTYLQRDITSQEQVVITDIEPGYNKAILKMSTGEEIDLSRDQEGIIVNRDGIAYADGSLLKPNADKYLDDMVYHTLIVPKAGKYKIKLDDGTTVWMNSDSKLTYPNVFHKNERVVELEGEAFFEVQRSSKPFYVKTKGQLIKVLGTSFNISAYTDDYFTRTTLFEGSIQVEHFSSNAKTLKLVPGDESLLEDGKLSIAEGNLAKAASWKNNRFYFENTPLKDILKQVSRWYDIAVSYEGAIPKEYFSGKMSQNITLNEFLDFLEGSEIKFRLENRTLIIY